MRLGLTVSLLLLSSVPALAQPLDWSGFYAGVHGGGGAGVVDFETANDEADHDAPGGLLGVQAGYNADIGNNLLLGVEATLSWSNMSGTALVDEAPPPYGDQYEGTDFHWLATFAPRLGYASGNWFVYGKLGVALATFDAFFDDDTGTDSLGGSRFGAVFGVGAEYAIDDNWSIRGEYDLVNLGNSPRRFAPYATAYDAEMAVHAFTVGVNYRF